MRHLLWGILMFGLTDLMAADSSPRPALELSCHTAGDGLTLDCLLRLRQAGRPLAGVRMTVGAHMPSMPMAHSVNPVQARAGATAGEYHVRLELEMPGVWALDVDLRAPHRERMTRRVRIESCQQKICPAQVLR